MLYYQCKCTKWSTFNPPYPPTRIKEQITTAISTIYNCRQKYNDIFELSEYYYTYQCNIKIPLIPTHLLHQKFICVLYNSKPDSYFKF